MDATEPFTDDSKPRSEVASHFKAGGNSSNETRIKAAKGKKTKTVRFTEYSVQSTTPKRLNSADVHLKFIQQKMMEEKLNAHKKQQAQLSKSSAGFPHKTQAQDENVVTIKENGIKWKF